MKIYFIVLLALVGLAQSNPILFKENQIYLKTSFVKPTKVLSPYFEVPFMMGLGGKSRYWKNTYIDFSLSGTQATGVVGEGVSQQEVKIAWIVGQTGFAIEFEKLLKLSFKGGLSLHFVKGEESALLLSSNESDFGYYAGVDFQLIELGGFSFRPYYELLQAWTLPHRSYFHVLGAQLELKL